MIITDNTREAVLKQNKNSFDLPKMGLKMREIGFQRTYIFKIFRGSMPPDPPRKVRLRRTITFSITYEHPLENLSYAPVEGLLRCFFVIFRFPREVKRLQALSEHGRSSFM